MPPENISPEKGATYKMIRRFFSQQKNVYNIII